MAREFTLYWSNLENYEKCPQKFLWGRGWGTIDVGGGPGRPKPKPVKESRHHAVMGMAIQKGVEMLYNNELWKTPAGLPERLVEIVERELRYEIDRSFIDWRVAPSKEEMLEVCRNGILGFLRTMKAHKLLGPYARAEVELLGWINKYTPVGGRADTILKRDDTGTTILDGKNSQKKGKYTDPDQLRWYALLYYLAYGVLPDRLGFIYYRFPHDPERGEEGVEWVPCTKDDIKGLAQRAVEARKGMDKEKFHPTPSPSTCRFCEFETVCEARQAQKTANARGRRNTSDANDLGIGDGFTDLDL